MKWLENHGFFDPKQFGLRRSQHVFFESTLKEKLARIRDCQCTHFIDDHTDVLLHGDFPDSTVKILYDPSRKLTGVSQSFSSWGAIQDFFKQGNS